MTYMAKTAEYIEIQKTEFWDSYVREVLRMRDTIDNFMHTIDRDDTISRPITMGRLWQEKRQLLNTILALPDRVLLIPDSRERTRQPVGRVNTTDTTELAPLEEGRPRQKRGGQ